MFSYICSKQYSHNRLFYKNYSFKILPTFFRSFFKNSPKLLSQSAQHVFKICLSFPTFVQKFNDIISKCFHYLIRIFAKFVLHFRKTFLKFFFQFFFFLRGGFPLGLQDSAHAPIALYLSFKFVRSYLRVQSLIECQDPAQPSLFYLC